MTERRYQKIGLTGTIGSGKSTVSARLSALGAVVLDADAVARRLLASDTACRRAVIDAFGDGILRADGSIDRKKLAAAVFSDPAARARLNSIVHPAVIEQMFLNAERSLSENPDTPVVFDAPLLIECGLQDRMDAVVLVTASRETSLQRVMLRDGCGEREAAARIDAQLPQEEKARYADFIVENDGTLDELTTRVDALYQILTGKRDG